MQSHFTYPFYKPNFYAACLHKSKTILGAKEAPVTTAMQHIEPTSHSNLKKPTSLSGRVLFWIYMLYFYTVHLQLSTEGQHSYQAHSVYCMSVETEPIPGDTANSTASLRSSQPHPSQHNTPHTARAIRAH